MLWGTRRSKQQPQASKLRKERQEKLTSAVEEGRTANVWLILEQDKNLVHYKHHENDRQKKTKRKDDSILEYRGETVLHIATNNNDIATAALLIQMGAKVNAKNDVGETALHFAGKQLNADLVKLLLAKGASVNERCNLGWTALHHVSFHAKNIKKKRTKTGKKVPAARKQNSSSDIALVHTLLDNGALVNVQTNEGWTPLVSEKFCRYTYRSRLHFSFRSLLFAHKS
jgi:ankyrin repeat protein